LGGEKIRPRLDFGVLLEQGPPLPFRHATPDTELDTVVERVRSTFEHDRAVPADGGCLALRGTPDKELVGIDPAAPCLAIRASAWSVLIVLETVTVPVRRTGGMVLLSGTACTVPD
jgi:hypothetical protein